MSDHRYHHLHTETALDPHSSYEGNPRPDPDPDPDPNPNPNPRRQPRPEYQDEFLEQEAAARQKRHAEGGGEEEEGGMGSLERQMDELLYAKDPSRVRLEASRAAPRPECVPRVLGEEEAATP